MTEVHHGLEGVVAFETQIAEPDKEGSALRYRGVDIEDIVGRVPFENVWGLLIDGAYTPGLAPAEPYNLPVHTGDVRVDVQAAVAMLAPAFGFGQTYDITDEQAREDIGRLAVMVLSYAAQSARGLNQAVVPQKVVDEGSTLAEKFLIRWKGEADPQHAHAIDAYWSSAAEHGMNASTFTARVITSTGADVAAAFSGAIGAMSGPLHGGAPSRVLGMIEDVEKSGDAEGYVKGLLDSGERLMGFGHRVYRAEDPRARVLRRTARELGAPRYEVAEALEKAALAELKARRPDRVLETNVEFWAAIVLDFAEVPPTMFTSMFTCARTGGWSAHILEQKRTGRLIRPSAVYAGRRPAAPTRSTAGSRGGRAEPARPPHRPARAEPVGLAHLPLLVTLNADPEVMRYVTGRGATQAETESEWVVSLAERTDAEHGLGYWAGYEQDVFVGWWGASRHLDHPDLAVLGWRLRRDAWGRGLATEGAPRWWSTAAPSRRRAGRRVDDGGQPGLPPRDGEARPAPRPHVAPGMGRPDPGFGGGRRRLRAVARLTRGASPMDYGHDLHFGVFLPPEADAVDAVVAAAQPPTCSAWTRSACRTTRTSRPSSTPGRC